MENNYKVKTVGKALKVLESFSARNPELGVTEISRMLGMQKSNVYDILFTFQQLGYIQQNQATGKYSLTAKVLEFSFVVNEQMGYAKIVYDIIENLANELQQIIYFAIPMDTDVFYLRNAHPQLKLKQFPYRNIAGERCPMYCSALGKSMLAFSGPGLMKKMEKVERIPFTPNTILTQAELEKEIGVVRRRGYSTDHAEHEFNIGAVSVPIMTRDNTLIAAISACGIVDSIFEKELFYVQCLKAAALEIRERL